MLFSDLAGVWKAFGELSSARTGGFGPDPIAWDQMLAWLEIHGVTGPDVREDYCQMIQAMDGVWLEHAAKAVTKDGN